MTTITLHRAPSPPVGRVVTLVLPDGAPLDVGVLMWNGTATFALLRADGGLVSVEPGELRLATADERERWDAARRLAHRILAPPVMIGEVGA